MTELLGVCMYLNAASRRDMPSSVKLSLSACSSCACSILYHSLAVVLVPMPTDVMGPGMARMALSRTRPAETMFDISQPPSCCLW